MGRLSVQTWEPSGPRGLASQAQGCIHISKNARIVFLGTNDSCRIQQYRAVTAIYLTTDRCATLT